MKIFCLILIFLMTTVCPARAEDLFQSETFFLNNGMEVVVIENHRAPVVTHMVWYKTGGIDDRTGKAGTAHLLEHMMFKGSKKVRDGEFSKIIARNGGEENAFTGADFTAYYQNIAKDRLELVMFLESDRMKNLVLTPSDFAPERQVVAEERLMRYDNTPNALFAERKKSILWNGHPYARPVIGTRAEIVGLELKDITAFYKKNYAPDNAVLVIAGDVTAAQVKPLAQKYYGALPPARSPVQKRTFPEVQIQKTRLEMTHPQAKIKTVSKEYAVPSITTDEKQAYAYQVLAEILGAPHFGTLYKQLVTRRRIASAAGAGYNGYALDKGTFSIYVTAPAFVDEAELETALNGVLARFKVTQTDVEKAKKRLTAGMEYINDSPETLANIVGTMRVLGLGLDTVLNFPEKIGAVTVADVEAALASLQSAPQITGVLLPEKTR